MTTSAEEIKTLTLSKDDIVNIHNAQLLTFLQQYSAQNMRQRRQQLHNKQGLSSLMLQSTTKQVASSPIDRDKQASQTHLSNYDTSTIYSVDLQDEIARLQTDIQTFITAVDQDGRHYNICLNNSDNVSVPIDESMQTDFDSKEQQLIIQQQNQLQLYEQQNTCQLQKQNLSQSGEQSFAGLLNSDNKVDVRHVQHVQQQQCRTYTSTNKICDQDKADTQMQQCQQKIQRAQQYQSIYTAESQGMESLQLMPSNSTAQSQALTKSQENRTKEKSKSISKSKVPSLVSQRLRRKPKYAVRSRDILRDDQQKRVEILLSQADVSIDAQAFSNPYAYSNAIQSRLSEIDGKLLLMQQSRYYKHVQSQQPNDDSLYASHMSGVDDTQSSSMSTSISRASQTSSARALHELGNSYLTFARQRQRRLHKLRKINEQLQRIHESTQRANTLLCTDANSIHNKSEWNNFCNVRPQWYKDQCEQLKTYTTLQGVNFVANDQSVQQMIKEAKEEHDSTSVEGVENKIKSNPYSSLIEEVHAALNRAKVFM